MSDRRSRRWLLSYLRPEWWPLSLGALTMSARAGVLLLLPWPLKFILDSVIFSHPLPHRMAIVLPDPSGHQIALLNVLALAMLALGALDAFLVYLGNRVFLNAGQRIVFAVRSDLFAHLQRLSLAFHRRHQGGEIMSRLSGDVTQLQSFVSTFGIDLLPHALTIAGIAVVMLIMDWRYALMVLSVAPVLFFIARHFSQRLRLSLRQVRRHEGNLWANAQEVLGSVQAVQASSRESHEDDRFRLQAGESLTAGLQANGVQARYAPTMNLAIAAATGVIVWYGALSVIHGQLSPGELLVFIAYLRAIATPARQLAKTGRILGRASVAMERIHEYLSEPSSIVSPPGAQAPAQPARSVRFERVAFAYQIGEPTLREVSFSLEPGKTVALVGPTGAGKSTIASLIARFYDPVSGAVTMDGHDLRSLPLDWLRRQVALVLQQPVLFRATVWENIAYGREGATCADAIRAAVSVGVAHLLEALPQGYDTPVSEAGLSLSGGQRQCVAIARAMLSEAPIVVLDEPSSSLDPHTEQALMRGLATLAVSRAALVIAHRLSTVMNADEILVLEHGHIVQRGTHSQLLAAGGLYAGLWKALRDDPPASRLRLAGT